MSETMTIRNNLTGKLPVLLVALVVLAGFQPGFAETQDIEQLRQSAEQGDATAQGYLGAMYFHGKGVPQSNREAVKWFRKAAEQGNAGAQAFLGGKYAAGEGVLQDFMKAHAWMNLAAAQGDKEAAQDRDRLAARMTPEQMAEAQDLAAELRERIESSKSD